MSDMAEAVHRLHSQMTLTVTTDLVAGQIEWTATLSGDDFLNGPWTEERAGATKHLLPAMADAVEAFRGRRKTWLERIGLRRTSDRA